MPGFTIRNRRAATSLATAALLFGGGTAATVFAPVAQADSSLNVVRGHLRGADAALRNLAGTATTRSLSGPLAVLEEQLRAAGLGSAKLYRDAHRTRDATSSARAATAMTKLAGQENRDATVLTPLVGQLAGSDQTHLATFIAAVVQGREEALSLATGLIGQLPSPARDQVAGVVAQLSNAGAGQAGLLASAISPGSVACPAIAAVSAVIAAVLASVQADLARIQSIVALLPAGSAPQLSGLLSGLPAQLNSLLASIVQAFNCASLTPVVSSPTTGPASISGPHPLSGPGVGSVGELVRSIVEIIQRLLSSFLPGISSGLAPGPAPVSFGSTGPVSSLHGVGMSFIPNFAGLSGGWTFGFGSTR